MFASKELKTEMSADNSPRFCCCADLKSTRIANL